MLASIRLSHPHIWSDNSNFSEGLKEIEIEIKKLQGEKT